MNNKIITTKDFRKRPIKEKCDETHDVLFDKNLMKQIHDYRANKNQKMIDWNKLKKTL